MLNANEFFEIVGDLYYDRYRRLRPGKSESPLSGHDSSDEDNVKQFKEWVQGPLAFNDAIEKIAKWQDKVSDLEAHAEDVEESSLQSNNRIRALEAAAEKVHGIIAEYWGPCMGSVESLLTLREAVGERATTWLPKVSDLPRVTSLETPAKPDRSEIPDWEGPWCKKCGAPIVTIPGFAPGCINNCPTPAETKAELPTEAEQHDVPPLL